MVDAHTPPEERGGLVIAPRVVERIAGIAAAEVDGVLPSASRLERLTARALPRADARVAGKRVRLAVSVSAAFPRSLSNLAAEVRDHVAARVTELVALEVDGVSVDIANVVHTPASRRRAT